MKPDPRPLQWTPELVGRFWDGMARAGLDDGRAFGRLARRTIHWLIARHLTPGGLHLDYGAGGGEVAAHLIDQGFPFSIYEPSSERQAKTEARLMTKAGYIGGPQGRAFDAVTCFEVLEHILEPDFEGVCDELAQFVRPGGKLIVSTPNREDLSLDTVYCPISNYSFHRWQHVRSIEPEMLVATFRRRGFSKVAIHQLDFFDALFEPYLHMMGFIDRPLSEGEIIPLHIHQIVSDIDGVMGGATRLLYIGVKD